MTKTELMDMLNDKSVVDRNLKCTIDQIKDTLYAFPDTIEFGSLKSIDDFISRGKFVTSILDDPVRDLNAELKKILNEVRAWATNQVEIYNAENKKVKEYEQQAQYYGQKDKAYKRKSDAYLKQTSAYGKQAEELYAKSKSGRRKRIVFLLVFGLIAAVALACTVVRLIDDTKLMFVPEIIGCVDLLLGMGFSIYEHNDDHKKDALHDETDEAVKNAEADIEAADGEIQHADEEIKKVEQNIINNSITQESHGDNSPNKATINNTIINKQ